MDLIKHVFFVILSLLYTCNAYSFSTYEAELALIKQSQNASSANKKYQQLIQSNKLTTQQTIELAQEVIKRYYLEANYTRASILIEQLIVKADRDKLEQQSATLYKQLGIIEQAKQNYRHAISQYLVSLVHYESMSHYLPQAHIHNNIALCYSALGQYQLALNHLNLAKPLYLKYGTRQDEVDLKLNYAQLESHLGRHQQAVNTYTQLNDYYQSTNDEVSQAIVNGNLAVSLHNLNRFDEAIDAANNALVYYQQQNNIAKQIEQLINLADINVSKKSYDLALVHLEKIALFDIQLQTEVRFNTHFLKARIHLERLTFKLANKEALQALSIAKSVDNLRLENLILEQLILISAANHDINIAQNYSRQRKDIIKQLQANKANQNLEKASLFQQSESLKEKVDAFKREKHIHELQQAAMEQRQMFVYIAMILIVFLFISIYRRYTQKRSQEELHRLVKVRTQALEDTSAELRNANLIKSQFLANMSHEIRTPLTAVIGHSEAIINNNYDRNTVHSYIKIINKNGHHLLDLINDILDISRIEANKLTLELETICLRDFIAEIDSMFAIQAKQKGIRFTLRNFTCEQLHLHVDQFRLKQILLNLCSNAIKFTSRGDVILTVEETTYGLKFIITDTGIGMDETQLNEIFDCFSQGDNTISRRFGGSGLGLSLSEQLANLMNSSISVQSEVGKGSEFTLHLKVEKTFKESKKTESGNVKSAPSSFIGHVLLAEDHPDNRELISRILEHLGLDVTNVENGQQAVDQCLQKQFDLVLLDIQMPIKNGIDALLELKALNYPSPIVAITANAMTHEVAEYISIGFNDHIKKPLERKQLIKILKQYLPQSNSDIDTLEMVQTDDLLAKFKASFPSEITLLEQCHAQSQWQEIGEQAHKLRGAASMFKLHSLEEAAHYLEQTIKFNDYDVVPEAVEGVIYCMQK